MMPTASGRVLGLLASFVGMIAVTFALLSTVAPLAAGSGDGTVPPRVDPTRAAEIRTLYALDRPAFVDGGAGFPGAITRTRFAAWIGRLVQGDLGASVAVAPGTPVTRLIAERLPVTLLVAFPAIVILFLVGVPLGLAGAARRGRFSDRLTTGLTLLLSAAPEPWVGTLLLIFLCSAEHWPLFPAGGLMSAGVRDDLAAGAAGLGTPRVVADVARHLALPVLLLVQPSLAVVVRQVRSAALAALGAPFVVALRARGIPEAKVRYVHLPRILAPSIAAMIVSAVPALVTGSLVVEGIFGLSGMGDLAWQAAVQRDLPVAMGVLVLAATATLASRFVADLLLCRDGARRTA